ncbi:hypothetical protein HG15A2_08570 [Adhaeretor mobilis]|uniref:Uncharacterized protein n=2 Tax=Adhaeretor mobilis TaxID=1930276 RepID=A0A517MRU6_9BACT|nr:hypothetical protein HG15A2_08570 [Adhaeretor mobilis]
MVESHERLPNFIDIRKYINQTLSQIEQLQPDRFELTETPLWRSGRPCGMSFCLHGPRAVRLTAVWETDGNTILFYGSQGERVQRTHLAAAPAIEDCIASAA